MIHEFYAVTRHSVYHVKDNDGDGFPSIEKIEGIHSIEEGIECGTLISIGKRLISYEPQSVDNRPAKRELEHNPPTSQKGASSSIIGLFKDRDIALDCFASGHLKPCDPRWLDQTRQAINEIGDNHPVFTLCHWAPMALAVA